jgi:hypothetical protein
LLPHSISGAVLTSWPTSSWDLFILRSPP